MEVDDEGVVAKQCFECDQSAIDILNIEFNPTNSMIVLWNKYQIFVYENLNFETSSKVLIPEFQIQCLIITKNYLLCLDRGGNIHVPSLKFKNSSQKQLKCAFQPKEQSIKTFCLYNEDTVLSLKYEYETFFLCLHKVNSNFDLVKNTVLISKCENVAQPKDETSILILSKFDKKHMDNLKTLFQMENITNDVDLGIISFDKQTIYGCLFDTNMEDETYFIQLYSCPSKIQNITIIDADNLYLYIALDVGTVLRINLDEMSKPTVIHLNVAIHKIIVTNDWFLYTDGITLWQSQNVVAEDMKFKELFVKNVNDLIYCNNTLICTTFSKLIYSVPHVFENLTTMEEEYCPADKVFHNAQCLEKTFEEIDKNNDILKLLNLEEQYLLAMSLVNRPEIMDTVIKHHVFVYEKYGELIKKNIELTLTENISQYFIPDNHIILVKINFLNTKQKIYNILSHLDLDIHVTISSKNNILQTTSLTIDRPLRKFNYVIPIKMDKLTELIMNLRIVAVIPGSLNERKKLWNVIYRKQIFLNSEHFIRTETNSNVTLKNNEESLEVLISKTCRNNMRQYGDLFKINEIKNDYIKLPFFVKLPENYEEIFKNKEIKTSINQMKTKFLMQQLSLEEFMKSKSKITLTVLKEKVTIEVLNDGFSFPILKVASDNCIIAFHIRNFLSNIIYREYSNYKADKEFINSSFYATTENMQKAVTDLIMKSDSEDFLTLMEQFERNIIGALPL